MSYHIKDKRRKGHNAEGMVIRLIKRFIKLLVVTALCCGVLAGIGYVFYQLVPQVQEASHQVLNLSQPIYKKFGVWGILGAVVFVIAAVWALGDELRGREKQRDTMEDIMR